MNAKIMKETLVEEKTIKLEILEAEIEEYARMGVENKEKNKNLENKKISLETELAEVGKGIQRITYEMREDIEEARKREHEIAILKKELDNNSREIEIHSLIQQRKDFYALLLDRLTKLQDDLKDTGVECKEPKEVIAELRKQIDSRTFNEHHAFLRGAKGRYDEYIRKQSENKVDGVKVSAKEHFYMNEYLDSFLKHDKVIEKWG